MLGIPVPLGCAPRGLCFELGGSYESSGPGSGGQSGFSGGGGGGDSGAGIGGGASVAAAAAPAANPGNPAFSGGSATYPAGTGFSYTVGGTRYTGSFTTDTTLPGAGPGAIGSPQFSALTGTPGSGFSARTFAANPLVSAIASQVPLLGPLVGLFLKLGGVVQPPGFAAAYAQGQQYSTGGGQDPTGGVATALAGSLGTATPGGAPAGGPATDPLTSLAEKLPTLFGSGAGAGGGGGGFDLAGRQAYAPVQATKRASPWIILALLAMAAVLGWYYYKHHKGGRS